MLKNFVSHPRKSIANAKYRFSKRFYHSDFTRFIVLTRSRTGSNLLISCLDSHPRVSALGEAFKELGGRDYQEVFEHCFCEQPRRIKARGFKIFYYHPLDGGCDELWDALARDKDLHIIQLRRENLLRVEVSQRIASKSGVWYEEKSAAGGQVSQKALHVSPDDLEASFKRTLELEQEGQEMFKDHPCLAISYEELVGDPSGTLSRVTEFLGVRPVEPKSTLRRQNPEKVKDLIENYQELKESFHGTTFEEFFED